MFVISRLKTADILLGGRKECLDVRIKQNNHELVADTGFSKGWKEAFMSGEQEPWVFRGGLTADLQRLLPVDSGTDLFLYKAPEVPSSRIYTVRPYLPIDRDQLYNVCAKTTCLVDVPDKYTRLPGDRMVGGYLELSSELCVVVEDETEIVGFAVAALDSRQFHKKLHQSFLREMKDKYPLPKDDVDVKIKELIEYFHNANAQHAELVHNQYPSVLTCEVLASVPDQSVPKRLLACLLAALRANGSFGVYVSMESKDRSLFDFYSKLGFIEIAGQSGGEKSSQMTYMGRSF